jgi:Domain of unknown function (DUF4345)
MMRQNFHLIISTIIVCAVALVYGFQPSLLFDVTISSTDEHTVFKALMGIYLGFSILWIAGMFKKSLWRTATMSNLVFMLGLAFGRILSMTLDGIPSPLFVCGAFGELLLGTYSIFQLKRFAD